MSAPFVERTLFDDGYTSYTRPVAFFGGPETNRPALNVLSRAGINSGDKIGGLVVHNYTHGPGEQIDQVGTGTALILKQARNGRMMPESNDKVSDAAFLQLTRASDDVLPARTITSIDRMGNLNYENDSDRQKSRFIRTDGSHLQILTQEGKAVIFNQPVQLPVVDPEKPAPLNHSIGFLPNGHLGVYSNHRWQEYAPVN